MARSAARAAGARPEAARPAPQRSTRASTSESGGTPTAADKRWARTTSECESGGDPKAIGGGGRYRGAFQFLKATWRASPKSPGGDPIAYSFRTQAVVALLLRKRDGDNHWPVCG